VRLEEAGLTGNMYCGLHEFPEMAYVLHTIDRDDLFIDIGANVGSYTILACAVRGARGICFVPVPATYQRLLDNLRLNDVVDRVRPLNMGIADRPGSLHFTVGHNCMNHVVAEGETGEAVRVNVATLDSVLHNERPSLTKIDVEGFETAVIKGAEKLLQTPELHTVIMELSGVGERYGFDEDRIRGRMHVFGFGMYTYEPFSRGLHRIQPGRDNSSTNTLFIRDISKVSRRIAKSPAVNVGSVIL
jgi:FkbM family methyltransferase